jgi:hypothetical protein
MASRTLTLRAVPERVVRGLRERARRNHRSVQKEILSILEGAVVDRAALADRLAELRGRARGGGLSVQEIRDAIAEGRP